MSYESYKASNNAQGQPVGALSAGSTTLILTTGQGARFPSVYPYLLNIEERNATSPFAVTKREIVKVTNRVGDTFTIVRSAGTCLPDDSSNTQGTTAFSFSNPSRTTVTHGITAEVVDDINTELALKLTRNGGLRTGLTPNSIIATNASGNEILLPPTAGHVVGFTDGGVPTTLASTVDINGTTAEPTLATTDSFLFYDVSAGANRKIRYGEIRVNLNSPSSPTSLFKYVGTYNTLNMSSGNNFYEFSASTGFLSGARLGHINYTTNSNINANCKIQFSYDNTTWIDLIVFGFGENGTFSILMGEGVYYRLGTIKIASTLNPSISLIYLV